ncbi:MAG: membrane protein insertase YidC [Erysipelotrichaceae bacterium]|jgi:YidC/Oxa1 family membrane protein insertase|nr:membrane protein insertase YidC [Erysipelotrichaceae bacterium]
MNKTKKTLTLVSITLGALLVLSGCTQNFCSEKDLAHISFLLDEGVSTYISQDEFNKLDAEEQATYHTLNFDTNANATVYTNVAFENNPTLKEVMDMVTSYGSWNPSLRFWEQIDHLTLMAAIKAFNDEYTQTKGVSDLVFIFTDATSEYYNGDTRSKLALDTGSKLVPILQEYGYQKFYGPEGIRFGNLETWINTLKVSLGTAETPNADFMNIYKSSITNKANQIRTCIATKDGYYANFGPNNVAVKISTKDWSYAWEKGVIEGLLVYPIAWLVDSMSFAFGAGGWGQLLAIFLMTLIIRGLLQAITFKATRSQAKMTQLQPEIARLQEKYPNANTNKYEKQRLSQEQLALYKKNGINMFAPFLVMIVQFPIFIAVWGAFNGASVLASDTVMGLRLSDTISQVITNWSNWGTGANGLWVAVSLFVLMSVAQFLQMWIPQRIQKKNNEKVARLAANPAKKSQANQMKIVQYIMIAVIIFMGFTLPSAMGFYWLISALISLGISLLIQKLIARGSKNKNNKTKVRTIKR